MKLQKPPSDVDTERSVLGVLMIWPERLDEVRHALRAEDFYHPSHATIYRAILSTADAGQAVDIVSVSSELRRMGTFDAIGGAQYIDSLNESVPAAANLETYVSIVCECSRRRRVGELGLELASQAQTGDASADVIDRAIKELVRIGEDRMREKPRLIGEVIYDEFGRIVEAAESRETPGVMTGFRDVDGLLSGLRPGQFVLLAARPKMGKTAFAIDVAMNAGKAGKRVVMFAMEMRKEELAQRVLSAESGVDAGDIRRNQLKVDDMVAMSEAAKRVFHVPVIVDDAPKESPTSIRSKIRSIAAEHGKVDLVIIDYIGLMEADERGDSRYREVSDISRMLKVMARSLNVPILVLAQLSRKPETRDDKRPMPSDLRDSGSLEQDADAVCFLYRDEVYDQKTNARGIAEFIVSLQRSGATGTARLKFINHLTRFETIDTQESYYDPAD